MVSVARRLLKRSPHRALRSVLRRWRLVVPAFPVCCSSFAWFRGRFTRRASWLGSRPATVVAASTRRPPVALTNHSTGPPKCRRSPFNRRAWRPVNSNVGPLEDVCLSPIITALPNGFGVSFIARLGYHRGIHELAGIAMRGICIPASRAVATISTGYKLRNGN